MNEPDKTGNVKALKGIIKKPAALVSIEDMNEAIRVAACSGYRAAASDHEPRPDPGARQS